MGACRYHSSKAKAIGTPWPNCEGGREVKGNREVSSAGTPKMCNGLLEYLWPSPGLLNLENVSRSVQIPESSFCTDLSAPSLAYPFTLVPPCLPDFPVRTV